MHAPINDSANDDSKNNNPKNGNSKNDNATKHTHAKSEFERLHNLANKTLLPKSTAKPQPTNKLPLIYEGIVLFCIILDLIIIGTDSILMSQFSHHVASWFGITDWLTHYAANLHVFFRIAGGFFTTFLIIELIIRWAIAIINKQYRRWFFFPFIHWYEVLGCFPQLRALRLLRAIFIARKLYHMGIQILPEKWITTGLFYYALILEELSDRVILTATDNIRQQFSGEESSQRILKNILKDNRLKTQSMLTSMLHQELAPRLKQIMHEPIVNDLSTHVGIAVQEALANTPELRRYLRMIPIAGSLIESQLHSIGQRIGENVVTCVTQRLTTADAIEPLIDNLSEAIASIDLNNPELDALIVSIVDDALTAFEEQIKVQQWKHQRYLGLD